MHPSSTFITDFDARAAESARSIAWMLINQARGLDPDRYPTDREWRDHFIKSAKKAWNTYRRYRKETAK